MTLVLGSVYRAVFCAMQRASQITGHYGVPSEPLNSCVLLPQKVAATIPGAGVDYSWATRVPQLPYARKLLVLLSPWVAHSQCLRLEG
jgi:hypothetical protein